MRTQAIPGPTFGILQLIAAVAALAVLLGFLAWAERNGGSGSESLQLSLYFYPRLAWVAGATAILALITAVADRRIWCARSLWLLLPFALPMAILAFGIVFQSHTGDGVAASTIARRKVVVEWSHWLHVPVGIALLGCFRSVSYWLIIGCISATALWLSFGSQVESWMCVTNIWL